MNIKEITNPSFELLLSHAKNLNIENIDMRMYQNILLIYGDKEIIGLINYCIVPSMKGKEKIFIRNVFYKNMNCVKTIIKSLCKFCENNNYLILEFSKNNKISSIFENSKQVQKYLILTNY